MASLPESPNKEWLLCGSQVSSFKAHRRHGEAHGTEDGAQRPTPFKSRGLACCDWCADAAAIDPSG